MGWDSSLIFGTLKNPDPGWADLATQNHFPLLVKELAVKPTLFNEIAPFLPLPLVYG